MLEFIRANEAEHAAKMAQWIFESGTRFFSRLFGDADAAVATLRSWIDRADSEFSGTRAALALGDGKPVGMFIALAGAEIPRRRRADLLDLIKHSTAERRAELKEHLATLNELTAPVQDDEFYLRTVAVDETERGRGFGHELVERALHDGRAVGFQRFRLDVDCDNARALHLYRSFGFEIIHEGRAATAGLHMYSLLLRD
ncbi:MAG TPA: GNAT family N-acetyltransferase [Chthoniobacterales bacterium]